MNKDPLPAAPVHHPTAQTFHPTLRTQIIPPLLVLPQIEHPAGPRFSGRSGPPPGQAPSATASTRGDSIPLEGWLPPRPRNTREPTRRNDGMRKAVNPMRTHRRLKF